MAFYPCLQAVNTGGSSAYPHVSLVQEYTTSGASTYTITESGTYLLIVSNSLQGSRDITLPAGRTAIINENIEPTSGSIYGTTVVVVDLQANDEIILSASPGGWTAFSKQVYKLEDATISSVYGTQANIDGHYSYTLSGSGTYILVGVCFGRTTFDYYDESSVRTCCYLGHDSPVNCTYTKVVVGTGDEIGQHDLYGYDGGGVDFIAINISY